MMINIAIGNCFLSILTAIMICFHDDSGILSRANNHIWGFPQMGVPQWLDGFVMENQPING